MPAAPGTLPVECGQCGAHYQIDPAGDIAGAACEGCGGTRFFRSQPSPTQSDGALRNMVDMDAGGVDRGGNSLGSGMGTIMSGTLVPHACPICGSMDGTCPHAPLNGPGAEVARAEAQGTPGDIFDEGVMMGDDGERPAGKRDNYMHSKVANDGAGGQMPCPQCNKPASLVFNGTEGVIMCPYCGFMKEVKHEDLLGQHVQQHVQQKIQNDGFPWGDHMTPHQGKVAAPPNMLYEETNIPEGMSLRDYNKTRQKAKCPGCGLPFNPLQGEGPMCARCELAQMNPELMTPPGTQRMMGTLNMEPYPTLWDESYLPKTAGVLAPALGFAATRILPFAIGHLMSNALGGGGGGQQAGGMAPEQPDAAPSLESLGSANIPFLLVADYDTPHSVKSVGEQHDDPEKQDQKEFNDGDKSPSNFENPNNQDSGSDGEDGVRDATPGYGFGENSPAMERAMMILPLLLHHYETGEGQGDPLIRGLHDALENENPDYLKNLHPDGEKYVQIILQQHKQPHGVHAGVNAFPSGLPEMPGTGPGMQAPGQAGGHCSVCGGTLAGDGSCPQCGAKQNPQGGMTPGGTGDVPTGGMSMPPSQMLGHVAHGQGPVTEEQKDVLHQAIDKSPWLFGDVLNQIQNQPNTPPLVDPSQVQPPPAPMGQMPGAGGMPVNDPSQAGGGQPMQPMAHTHTADAYTDRPDFLPKTNEDWHQYHPDDYSLQGKSVCPKCQQPALSKLLGNCHNCGYKIGQDHPEVNLETHDPRGSYSGEQMNDIVEGLDSMQPHWGKQADANNRVPRCPHCKSGSTTLKDGGDADGEQAGYCHACFKSFSLNGEKEARVILTDLVNPTLLDAAEQHSVRPEEGHDPSLTWQDKNGQPIQVGQVYDLHTPGIDTPDEVKVISKKPEELGLKLVGEFSSIHGDENTPDFTVTPQQMQSSQYQFVPSQSPEGGQEQPLGGMPGMEQIPQSPPTTDETGSSYPNPGTVSHLVVADEVEDDEDLCHKCGYTHITHTASSPTRTMHECFRCNAAWETTDNDMGRESNVASWIYDDTSDFGADYERFQKSRGGTSRSLAAAAAKDERLQTIKERLDNNKMTREAGRHFTPGEQRALINEKGKARNADLLDLSNTHYETRWDSKANGLNAPDEHLVLGL